MTPEQARRLNRIVWLDRLRRLGPAVLGLLLLAGGFAFLTGERLSRVDRTLEAHTVGGEVVAAVRMAGRQGGFQVHARLDDGREIDAASRLSQPPFPGERVEIRAASHSSGKVTYDVVRLLN